VPKPYVGLAMEILERQYGHPVEPAGALALAASLWYEETNPRGVSDPRRVHINVMSGANVTEEMKRHFAEAVPELRKARFAQLSNAHIHRKRTGTEEVLARAQGHTALHDLRIADGPTSHISE
jgi:threonine dehydratase